MDDFRRLMFTANCAFRLIVSCKRRKKESFSPETSSPASTVVWRSKKVPFNCGVMSRSEKHLTCEKFIDDIDHWLHVPAIRCILIVCQQRSFLHHKKVSIANQERRRKKKMKNQLHILFMGQKFSWNWNGNGNEDRQTGGGRRQRRPAREKRKEISQCQRNDNNN